MSASVSLRPRSFSELFDAAFLLLRARLQPLLVLSAIVAIPGLVVGAVNSATFGDYGRITQVSDAAAARTVALAIAASCWVMVGIGAMVGAASAAYLGEPVDVGASLRAALRRAGALIGGSILVYLIMLIALVGIVLAIVVVTAAVSAATGGVLGTRSPAVAVVAGVVTGVVTVVAMAAAFAALLLVFSRYTSLPAVVMVEGAGASDALRRSAELSVGHRRRIAGMLVLLAVVSVAVAMLSLAVGYLVSNIWLMGVVQTLLLVPVYPLVAALLTVIYYDLRIRKEGFDIEWAARELERADSVGGAPVTAVPL